MSSYRKEIGDSETLTLRDLLKKFERFSCPVFQRRYSWGPSEVNILIEDLLSLIIDVSSENEYRFLGAVVLSYYEEERRGQGESSHIVDGQQRLISLFLINFALEKINQELELNRSLHLSNFFVDDERLDGGRVKLLPSFWDRRDMNYLLKKIGRNKKSLIVENDLPESADQQVGENNIPKNFLIIYEQLYEVVDQQENPAEFLEDLQLRILDNLCFSVITVGNEMIELTF